MGLFGFLGDVASGIGSAVGSVGKSVVKAAPGAALGFLGGGPAGAVAGGLGSVLKGGGSLPQPPGEGGGILGIDGLGVDDLLKGGLGVLGGIRGASAESRAGGLMNEALGLAREDYASRAPMRERAQSLLMGPMPTGPDLSYLRDAANPYATLPTPPVGGAAGAGAPPPPPLVKPTGISGSKESVRGPLGMGRVPVKPSGFSNLKGAV